MVHSSSIFLALASSVLVTARVCTDIDVPLQVTTENALFQFPTLKTNEQAADLQFNFALRDQEAVQPSGYETVSGNYTINARFCTPDTPVANSKTIQVLTHGVGFDKNYWDPEVSRSNYSYVDTALEAGYSVFFYDRLGNGKSSKPNPNTRVQSFVELEILTQLTTLIREGSIGIGYTPEKVIHVGHSYGSVLSNRLAVDTPELSDGLILTGYGHNSTWLQGSLVPWGFQIARLQDPVRFANFESEYLTWATKWSNQFFFLKYPFFSTEALDYAEEGKGPVGLGTLWTINSGDFVASRFEGPVLIITGQYDLPFCGGNCTGVLQSSEAYFPNSTALNIVIHPDAGHGINLHFSAKDAYKTILDFLEENL
ncbi:Alpha/Beta hydrolase protein [Morchella snyderi]|nr:Alpha/Beta hydrolase protein [Morchella snyderi]